MRNSHRILVDNLRQNTAAKYKHVEQNKILDKLLFRPKQEAVIICILMVTRTVPDRGAEVEASVSL